MKSDEYLLIHCSFPMGEKNTLQKERERRREEGREEGGEEEFILHLGKNYL